MQAFINADSIKSKNKENISVKEKIKDITKKIEQLIIWREYFRNDNISLDNIDNKFEDIDFLEFFDYFNSIKIIEINNEKIILSIKFPLDYESDEAMIEEITFKDFNDLFIKEWIIIIKRDREKIEKIFNELIELLNNIDSKPKWFIAIIKDKIMNLI